MALSMDDRLLGEKTHYYCSSSEDECDDDERDPDQRKSNPPANPKPTFIPDKDIADYTGHSVNTGPKGVVEDWRRYKQLETENRDETERERLALAKKLSITCRSQLDDEREKVKDAAFMEDLESQFDEFQEEFLKEYRLKRIEEMRHIVTNLPRFGKVYELNKEQFLEAIDDESSTVTIVIHIFEKGVSACDAMDRCLQCLANEYSTVKFCKIRACEAKLSLSFAISGVPALLVYKAGELIGNFVRLADEFGQDFFATDIESFLIEHGMLPEQPTHTAAAVIRSSIKATESNDSDYDVD